MFLAILMRSGQRKRRASMLKPIHEHSSPASHLRHISMSMHSQFLLFVTKAF